MESKINRRGRPARRYRRDPTGLSSASPHWTDGHACRGPGSPWRHTRSCDLLRRITWWPGRALRERLWAALRDIAGVTVYDHCLILRSVGGIESPRDRDGTFLPSFAGKVCWTGCEPRRHRAAADCRAAITRVPPGANTRTAPPVRSPAFC